jgi:hypothetical protein
VLSDKQHTESAKFPANLLEENDMASFDPLEYCFMLQQQEKEYLKKLPKEERERLLSERKRKEEARSRRLEGYRKRYGR